LQPESCYRHVFLDFDGVLCDSLSVAMREFNALRAQFPALPAVSTRDDMVAVYGGSLKTCLLAWLSESEHVEFFRAHADRMAATQDELSLFSGVPALMRKLRPAGASLITSAYGDHVRCVFKRRAPDVDLGRLHAVAGKDSPGDKAEKIKRLAAEVKIPLRHCLYVGDLESDLLYCRKVPIDVALVTYGYHPRWHLEQQSATYLADSVEELADLLRQHALLEA